MAIQFTDYANIPVREGQQYDILTPLLKGFEFGRSIPAGMREAESERLKQELQRQQNELFRPTKEAEISLSKAQEKNQLAQALMHEQQSQNPILNPHLTPTMRELAAVHGFGTPAFYKALAETHGIIEGEGVPQNAVPLRALSANERNVTVQQMQSNMKMANGMERSYKILSEMDEILEKHPKMADYISTALVDPEKAKTVLGQLKRKGVNKEDLAAIEKFNKLSADLVIQGGQALGGSSKWSDARQQLIEAAKPVSGNTYDANKFVIRHMREYMKYGEPMRKDYQNAFKNRYALYTVPEDYEVEDQARAIGQAQQESGVGNPPPKPGAHGAGAQEAGKPVGRLGLVKRIAEDRGE